MRQPTIMPYFVVMGIVLSVGSSSRCEEKLADAIHAAVLAELHAWYPRVVDSLYGGFIPTWSFDWQNLDDGRKGIVTQARHTWSASVAALRFPDYLWLRDAADAGFRFLAQAMWDSVYGGFFEFRDRQGGPTDPEGFGETKRLYGNVFGIYALSAYYALTGKPEALSLAQATFHWLDVHARDPVYGGYFNQLLRDGTPMHLGHQTYTAWDVYLAGLKDYNSSIHLLEAYTSLYRLWPDSLLRVRLSEIVDLLQKRFIGEKGYLTLFFKADWTPISYRDSSEAVRIRHRYVDHVSFGHDIETAYLLLEAADALGMPRDPDFDAQIIHMVDRVLKNGWDPAHGGLFEAGYDFGETCIPVIDSTKTWWVQAEALNTLLLMAQRYPQDPRYSQYFTKQWAYIQRYFIDSKRGGWYETGLDADPEAWKKPKGHHWKTPYHNLRALLNCLEILESSASIKK